MNFFIDDVYFFTVMEKTMKNRSYYSSPDMAVDNFNRCSIESDAAPLIVNCAGRFDSSFPLTTDNRKGRVDYYFMYIKKGELDVSFPDGNHRAAAGQALIFAPRYPYRYSFSGDELSYYWCHFTGSYAEGLLRELGFSELPILVELGRDTGITERFEKILSLFSAGGSFLSHSLANALEALLIASARIHHGEREKPLARSLAYINEAYTREIRIPELAKMENLSPSRYNVLFNSAVGMPPVRYIAKLRMQSACELLITTDLSVKQIGVSVGYGDPHFFSKQFRAMLGISPLRYRENFVKNSRAT